MGFAAESWEKKKSSKNSALPPLAQKLTVGAQLVHNWHTPGSQLAHTWLTTGTHLAHTRFTVGAQLAHTWLTLGAQLDHTFCVPVHQCASCEPLCAMGLRVGNEIVRGIFL